MTEEMKSVVQEIKEGLSETMTPAITKEVIEAVEKKIAENKPVIVDKDAKAEEAKKATVDMVKDMFGQVKAGAKAVQKDLTSGTATEGKELVPEYFNSEVLRVSEKHGVARRDARVVPMQGKTESWPTIGSVSVYRVNEGAKIPAVSPTTGQVKLTAKKLAAIIPMTREVLEYANINTVNVIAALAGEAMAKAEDTWAFKGLASGEGIFQNSNVVEVPMAPGKITFGSADFDDLLDLQNAIDDHAFDGVKYYMRRAMYNSFRKIASSLDDHYIFQAPGSGQPATIWNTPVELVPVLPSPTDAGSQAGLPFMGLYNLQHLLMGEARGYELEMSREATITSSDGETVINLWEQDMVAIRVMESIDFAVSNADKAFATLVTASDLS